MEDIRVERILRVVECLPRSRCATYKTVGLVAGESPRTVGKVMALWGGDVPWWRVCNAQGLIPGHEERTRPHWESEGLLDPSAENTRADLGRAGIGAEELFERARARLAEAEALVSAQPAAPPGS